jgi:hypothetical protein
MDWRLYPRKEIDHQNVVRNYARALKAGSVFPRVKIGVLAGKKIIVDGVHRVSARKLLNIDHVDCAILPFESEAELFAEAVRLNSTHGKGFTVEELNANVNRLRRYKFDIKDIVAITHVPASEIRRLAPVTRPVKLLMAPCGKKIRCNRQPSGRELVQLKKALILCRDMAKAGCIPVDDGFFKALVVQCRSALEKVRFNV